LAFLGEIALKMDDLDQAIGYVSKARQLYERLLDNENIARVTELAVRIERIRQPNDNRQEQQIPANSLEESRRNEALKQKQSGKEYLKEGRVEEARKAFNTTIDLLEGIIDDAFEEADTVYELALLEKSAGNVGEAISLYERAYTLFVPMGHQGTLDSINGELEGLIEIQKQKKRDEEERKEKRLGLSSAQSLLLQTIQGLIEENKIEKALDVLYELGKQTGADIWQDIISQSGIFRSAKKAMLEGSIDNEEFRSYEAQTKYALIELMKVIPRKIELNAKLHNVDTYNFGVPESPVLEKIVGNRGNLFKIDWLEKARNAANAVCRVVCDDGNTATGFLTDDGYVFTNNHVVNSLEVAKTVRLEFNYEEGKSVSAYQVDIADYISSPPNELDFTRLKVIDRTESPLSQWGYVIFETENLPLIGEDVIIIQQPRGGYKQFKSDEVLGMMGRYIFYTTATEPGSSGSPVLTKDCKVIAIHHAGKSMAEGGIMINEKGDLRGANQGILFKDIFDFINRIK